MKKNTQNIYQQLSKKYNLPHQVIEVICNHPFMFANKVISDEEDTRTLMFSYLGKIKIKKKYEDDKKSESKRPKLGSADTASWVNGLLQNVLSYRLT